MRNLGRSVLVLETIFRAMTPVVLKSTTLESLFEVLPDLEWGHSVFVASGTKPDLASRCWVVDAEFFDDKEAAEFGTSLGTHGATEFLSVADLQDVQQNLLCQTPRIDADLLLNAIRYYCENDAFIDLRAAT